MLILVNQNLKEAKYETQRIEVIIVSVLILLVCAEVARREVARLANVCLTDFVERIRGARPSVCDGLRRRKERLESFLKAKAAETSARLCALILLGFLIPTAMLGAAVSENSWLWPGHAAFVYRASPGQVVEKPSPAEVGAFVKEQFLGVVSLGGTDIFGGLEAPISLKHGDVVPEMLLWGYRLFVGAYELVVVWILIVLAIVVIRGPKELVELREKVNKTCTLVDGS